MGLGPILTLASAPALYTVPVSTLTPYDLMTVPVAKHPPIARLRENAAVPYIFTSIIIDPTTKLVSTLKN